MPTNYVSKLLGHTNLTTTSRHLNTLRRGLHAAMQKVEQHQVEQKALAQRLHTDEKAAAAVVSASNEAMVASCFFPNSYKVGEEGEIEPTRCCDRQPLKTTSRVDGQERGIDKYNTTHQD